MEALRNMKSKAFLETKHENMTLLHIAAINEDLPMI
jgi:ankyrin repeat protein